MTSIVILNYNSYDDTLLALESVLKSGDTPYQIIVVDNASQDNSMEFFLRWAQGSYAPSVDKENSLSELCLPFENKPINYKYYNKDTLVETVESNEDRPSITFIQSGENLGFAGGNNVGITHALQLHESEYIWLLNPDTLVQKQTLSTLINYADTQDTDVGIIGSALLYYYNPKYLQALGASFNKYICAGKHIYGHELYENHKDREIDTSKIDMIIGASMLVRRSLFEKIGLLEARYFLYYEEIDFATRAKKEGYKLGLCSSSVVYHKEGGAINAQNKDLSVSDFSDFYAMRNRILFTKKFYPHLLGLTYGGLFLSALLRLKRGEKDKAKMIIKIIFGKREYSI